MTRPTLNLSRRNAWRLAKPMAPVLASKTATDLERAALDALLGLTGPALRVDWVELAFNSRHGGRFKLPGAYGALYAALSQPVAVAEAAFNWSKIYASTARAVPPGTRLLLAVLRLKVTGLFLDVRKGHPSLHDPASHAASQAYGLKAQMEGWDGIAYRSVRARGTCVVAFRRTVPVSCEEAGRVFLVWDGAAFTLEP